MASSIKSPPAPAPPAQLELRQPKAELNLQSVFKTLAVVVPLMGMLLTGAVHVYEYIARIHVLEQQIKTANGDIKHNEADIEALQKQLERFLGRYEAVNNGE